MGDELEEKEHNMKTLNDKNAYRAIIQPLIQSIILERLETKVPAKFADKDSQSVKLLYAVTDDVWSKIRQTNDASELVKANTATKKSTASVTVKSSVTVRVAEIASLVVDVRKMEEKYGIDVGLALKGSGLKRWLINLTMNAAEKLGYITPDERIALQGGEALEQVADELTAA